jgi:hypothetical protein
MTRNPFRTRVAPKNYKGRGKQLAEEMERCVNIPYLKSDVDFQCGENIISFPQGRYKPEDLALNIADRINKELQWVDDTKKVSGTYNASSGQFVFSRYYGPFSMQFPEPLACLIGFSSSTTMSGSLRYESNPIFYAHYVDSMPIYPSQHYSVEYDTHSDSISIRTQSFCGFSILPCPIQDILGFSSTSNSKWISLSRVQNLGMDQHLYVCIKDIGSNGEWYSKPYGSISPNKMSCIALLSLDQTERRYTLQRSFKCEKDATFNIDALDVAIYNSCGIPYNTNNLQHLIVFRISI